MSARQIARLSAEQTDDELWPLFWATVVVRATIEMALGAAALVYALAFSSDPFSRYYLLSILPGFAVWTGNAVGLLDGLKLSGLSGVTGLRDIRAWPCPSPEHPTRDARRTSRIIVFHRLSPHLP